MSINRTKFRIIFQTFRMEPNGGHLKRLAPRWSARPLKHDDEILCNLRLFFYVFLVSDLALNIFSGSGKRGKWCRQELLFGMGWVFQYVFCNSYETKHATTRTCWLRNLQICWVWSQTLRFWPESSPETPSWWCSFLSTLPIADQRKVGPFLKSNMGWWADVEELRYVLPESLAFPSWCGRWQWEGGCFQFIVDVKLRVSGLSILDSLIWDGSHWSVTLSCVSIDDFVLVMPLQHFLRTSACTASYSETACNLSLSQAIKHLSTRPCHVKKSQWTVSWLLQFSIHDWWFMMLVIFLHAFSQANFLCCQASQRFWQLSEVSAGPWWWPCHEGWRGLKLIPKSWAQNLQAYWRLAAGSSVVPQEENQHLGWIWGQPKGMVSVANRQVCIRISQSKPSWNCGFASLPLRIGKVGCNSPKGGLAKAAFTIHIDIIL